jgi:two-component system, LytTR family, response regulator
MKIKCVAIDDEPLALPVIEKMLQKFPMLNLVATSDDAISGAEIFEATSHRSFIYRY